MAREFSQHLECGVHRSESSPEKYFALIPHPVTRCEKNYSIIIKLGLPLTRFYRSGAQRNNVYKRDVIVTSWRFHNRAWQPQRHDRLPETSGTPWINRGSLTNQRCSLAKFLDEYVHAEGWCSEFQNVVVAILPFVHRLQTGCFGPPERYVIVSSPLAIFISSNPSVKLWRYLLLQELLFQNHVWIIPTS